MLTPDEVNTVLTPGEVNTVLTPGEGFRKAGSWGTKTPKTKTFLNTKLYTNKTIILVMVSHFTFTEKKPKYRISTTLILFKFTTSLILTDL